jgi:uncharacterized protein (DUF433 family)
MDAVEEITLATYAMDEGHGLGAGCSKTTKTLVCLQRPRRPADQGTMKKGENMATLDWSQCPAVESVPGRRCGAWVFRDTRMPVATVFENLEAGASIAEIVEQFHVTHEQIKAVLEFAARSLDAPPASAPVPTSENAHSL